MPDVLPKVKFTFGVGRAIDPDWARYFEDNVQSVLPPGVEYKRRKLPGIVYATGVDLDKRGVYFGGRSEDEKRAHVEAYSRSLVASLCEEEEEGLDRQTAVTGVTLDLHKPHAVVVKRRNYGFRAGIIVDDTLNPTYEDEYVIRSEREVFEDEFELKRTSSASSLEVVSMHRIALGQVVGNVTAKTVQALDKVLEGPVPLMAIGVVSVET